MGTKQSIYPILPMIFSSLAVLCDNNGDVSVATTHAHALQPRTWPQRQPMTGFHGSVEGALTLRVAIPSLPRSATGSCCNPRHKPEEAGRRGETERVGDNISGPQSSDCSLTLARHQCFDHQLKRRSEWQVSACVGLKAVSNGVWQTCFPWNCF